MFAIFNLGLQEFIILGILGLMTVGVVATVLLVVFVTNRGKDRDDSRGE